MTAYSPGRAVSVPKDETADHKNTNHVSSVQNSLQGDPGNWRKCLVEVSKDVLFLRKCFAQVFCGIIQTVGQDSQYHSGLLTLVVHNVL